MRNNHSLTHVVRLEGTGNYTTFIISDGYATANRQNYYRYNYAPPVACRGYSNAYVNENDQLVYEVVGEQ